MTAPCTDDDCEMHVTEAYARVFFADRDAVRCPACSGRGGFADHR